MNSLTSCANRELTETASLPSAPAATTLDRSAQRGTRLPLLRHLAVTLGCAGVAIALGCNPAAEQGGGGSATNSSASNSSAADGGSTTSQAAGANVPTYSLAWSEYPSWSVFGVAHELGLLDAAAGKMGKIEQQYGVDIELKQAGYDTCLNMFASNNCDAVCITNMDAYIVSPSRSSVAVLPTSTSQGADACLVTEAIADLEALKSHSVYGLEGTVSQYCFARCLELSKQKEADYKFVNLDPAIAAQNMAQKSKDHQAIMVWNPFVLQTLRDRPDVRVLFDSSMIPGEIVDMVAVGEDVLAKPKAQEFVQAIMAAFYGVNQAMADSAQGDEVLVALGKKFSNLGLEDMKLVVEQTKFYDTPEKGLAILEGAEFKEKMELVTGFCNSHGLLKESATVGYGSEPGHKLRFDSTLLKAYKPR